MFIQNLEEWFLFKSSDMKCRRNLEIIIVSGLLYPTFGIGSLYFLAIGNEYLYYGSIMTSSILFLLAFISFFKLTKITGRLIASERDDIKI